MNAWVLILTIMSFNGDGASKIEVIEGFNEASCAVAAAIWIEANAAYPHYRDSRGVRSSAVCVSK